MASTRSDEATITLLNGRTIKRIILCYNNAHYIRYLGTQVPVARDKIVDGKQTYKEVQRFKDAN